MVQPGIGLDTPRTAIGDATYLNNPDFDISEEQSFQSPSKDNNNLVQQLQNGRRGINLKTPRSRAPFGDRRNTNNNGFGGEFTPLLKSATRNNALKLGKENGVPRTPAFLRPGGLDNIAEDLSPVPNMDSTYADSYASGTPIPQIDSSSLASTPLAMLPRRAEGANVLQDGNQLSLREQENVIDKIEKENFGLKLKIHFLEEALRKAGPGFSEMALKENTDLKVDKVTMQKELHRYRKTLTTAERDLESYRQQILDMQGKMKRRHADEGAQEELDLLRQALHNKEIEVQDLQQKLENSADQNEDVQKLRDSVTDLEHDVREKERMIDERDDQIDDLKAQVNERDDEVLELEEKVKAAKRREIELEEKNQLDDELEEAKETISDLEQDIKRLQIELDDVKDSREELVSEKERAMADLEELQDEMANKSITTKGLSRQIEEKANRLQDDLEDLREKHESLEQEHQAKIQEADRLQQRITDLDQSGSAREIKLREELDAAVKDRDHAESQQHALEAQLKSVQTELQHTTDQKDLLQVRHDALTAESAQLQTELSRAKARIENLEEDLQSEKSLSLQNEREVREQYKSEIDRLHDEIEDLRADVREKERLYDDDNDKWDSERRTLESQRDLAEEQADGLKLTIEKLQQVEGTLSGKESKLQEAVSLEKERHLREEALLTKQIDELTSDLQLRQNSLDEARSELSNVREELRLSQREHKSLSEKIEALEDEIEVLQTSLDEENDRAQVNVETAKHESDALQQQLDQLKRDVANVESRSNSTSIQEQSSSLKALETKLAQTTKSEQVLQDQLANINLEMHSLRNHSNEVEAERDEIKSQLRDLKSQDDTFRADQEKIELRTAKMKLDVEVRRLRDETRVLTEQKTMIEHELQSERDHADADHANFQQRETEYIQRESATKETIRTLKRQISELERQSHNLELSILQTSSPHSSVNGSVHKSEILEVRSQLATAHQTLKDLRAQLKDTERDAAKKLTSAHLDHQSQAAEWDSARFTLERDLSAALSAKSALEAQATAAESTAARLKSKIARLEQELHAERATAEGDRTMALERHDLHEMLRETQVQADKLELAVQTRDASLAALTTTESSLRAQLKRIREERTAQKERASRAMSELEALEKEFRGAKRGWEAERVGLTRGVRFANSSSLLEGGAEAEVRHGKELRGLAMQIEWLRARCRREEGLRADAAYAKRFMLLQVELFGAWYVYFPFFFPLVPSYPFYPLPSLPLSEYLQIPQMKKSRTNSHAVTKQTSKSSPKWA
jgi:chromosome segregation ATPase